MCWVRLARAVGLYEPDDSPLHALRQLDSASRRTLFVSGSATRGLGQWVVAVPTAKRLVDVALSPDPSNAAGKRSRVNASLSDTDKVARLPVGRPGLIFPAYDP